MKRALCWFMLSCLLLGCSQGEAATEVEAAETAQPSATQEIHEPEQIILTVEAQTPTPTGEPAYSPAPTESPTPEPTATSVPMLGVLSGVFADKFVEGDPVITDMSYQSDRLAIFLTRASDNSKTIAKDPFSYVLADVYFQNMEDFRAGFYKTMDFKYKYVERMNVIAQEYNALFAISGDYIRYRETGICLRNGVLYRNTPDSSRDVGVIYLDGRMETYEAGHVPLEELLADETVWHIIGFGPELLDENGQAKTSFNTKVSGHNPRCAIGYFEPGHYCFLMVEGRSSDTDGLTMVDLSEFMYSLGCKKAFNLDGGATAGMYFNGQLMNSRGHIPREMHDIFYIPQP